MYHPAFFNGNGSKEFREETTDPFVLNRRDARGLVVIGLKWIATPCDPLVNNSSAKRYA